MEENISDEEYDDYVKKYNHQELKKEMENVSEDVKKFGKIEGNQIIIDDGLQKQTIGTIKDIGEEETDFIYQDDKGKDKVSITNVVVYLIKKYHFKTIFGTKDEKVYFYYEGIYKNNGKEKIKILTEELLGSYCSTHIVNEVLEKIKRKTAIDYKEFENIPDDLICIENGILNLTNNILLNHSPDFYFTKKVPLFYNKESKIDKIKTFLEEVLYPEDIPTIQEWFGFCLYKKYFIKKAIILFGERNTGKTVLLNILSSFIGDNNIAGLSLQRISKSDKFGLASLKDKMINVYDDLSSSDLSDSGGFKIATGGGHITAEHKFGDSFQFVTYAKNIFATNHIPNVKDIDDDAYYDRWIPIQFDNQVEKDKQDNFLGDKLVTKEEMSGLLNWALEGLNNLLEKGIFSYNKDSIEIKRIMQRQNNPLISFVEDVLHQKDGNKISKEVMYKIYSNWCQEKKVPRLSKEQIGRSLSKHTNYIIAKGGTERVWENVNINPNWLVL